MQTDYTNVINIMEAWMEWDASKLNSSIKAALGQSADDKTKILSNYLFEAPLLIPALNISNKPIDGKWEILDQSETARIKIIKNSKGQESIPVFTDQMHLQLWMPKGSYYQAFHGKDVFNICVMNNFDGLVVNPGSDIQFEVFGDEVKNILNRN